MITRFFIDRPIFASVIAIVTLVAGAIALVALPVEQFPDITPPTVMVMANYPGANAEILSETVAQPIEEEVNGVEDMIYMSSACANDGSYRLTVTFRVGTNMDMATVLVQNRVTAAMPRLPEEVQRLGVTTRKRSTNIVLIIGVTSTDSRYDELFLNNFATLRLKDELLRVEGVGDLFIFGAGDYSMRIWLDSEKLRARELTTTDVIAAIQEQNVQVAAGQIGQPPADVDQNFQYTINTLGRLEDIEQFENIILKSTDGGRITQVKDVARVELGSQVYDVSSQLHGKPAAMILVFQLPGSNALEVSEKVRAKLTELAASFPDGIGYTIPLDTTQFISESIHEVVKTLFIAVALVIVTLYVFLQEWRATLIPAVTIPVSLIGTFVVMAALGVSINTLSLFGLLLAIGIVVDDAIVVVENVSRHLNESRSSARDATINAMGEVVGPIIATTLVLLAVFVPAAFVPGMTGRLYRQFAMTIATATVLSSVNALTLSPALCALVLRPTQERRNPFFRAFNWTFGRTSRLYERVVGALVRRSVVVLLMFAFLAGMTYWGVVSLPISFFPEEDMGYAIATAQLPDAASRQRTLAVVDRVNQALGETDGISTWVSVPGYAVLDDGTASNTATFWIPFDPWEERTDPALSRSALVAEISRKLSDIQEANLFVFTPPAIPGLGRAGGFTLRIQDRADVGLDALQRVTNETVADANVQPGLARVYSTFRSNVPQLFAQVDRVKAKTIHVPLSGIFDTLQTFLGSTYVNDFNKFGRIYQVRVQAESRFRSKPDDIKRLEVRNVDGEMVPLATLIQIDETLGPQLMSRYNMYPSAQIVGAAAPGHSSGEALATMERLVASELPTSMGFEWSGMSYQEKATGGQAPYVFALAVLLVYLVLCAQYESWLIPFAVILAVPLALGGTVVALMSRGMDNNVYAQIGMVLLVAMASKNAILIAEFARDLHRQGKSRIEAAVEAARLRFRPVLMTGFTFILGVVPLVIATGAGAASRQALGTAVFGGMIAATALAVLFVPTFYVIVAWTSHKLQPKEVGHEAL